MTERVTSNAAGGRLVDRYAVRSNAGLAATLDGIVRSILPEYPSLDPQTRRVVEDDASRYVITLIRSMPGFLRLPYALAVFCFEWLALLCHGRRFRGLAPADQASYIARWSEAPLLPMRDFVKLIRSSALLAYFDHPLVTRQLEAHRQDDDAPAEAPAAARA